MIIASRAATPSAWRSRRLWRIIRRDTERTYRARLSLDNRDKVGLLGKNLMSLRRVNESERNRLSTSVILFSARPPVRVECTTGCPRKRVTRAYCGPIYWIFAIFLPESRKLVLYPLFLFIVLTSAITASAFYCHALGRLGARARTHTHKIILAHKAIFKMFCSGLTRRKHNMSYTRVLRYATA